MDPREKILAAQDRKLTPLPIPEWDETVYIPSGWRLSESDQVTAVASWEDDKTRIAAQVSLVARREDGSALFTEADIPALMDKNRDVLIRIVRRFTELNGGNAAPNSEAAPA